MEAKILPTTDAVIAHDGAVLIEYNPAYLTKSPDWAFLYFVDGYSGKSTFIFRNHPSGTVTYALNGFNKSWRCWTARPTPEQSVAEKWSD